MAIYRITLTNIDDSADPGRTIVTFLNANATAVLAQNPQTQIQIQRLS
jgi:hypothetical protein